MRMDLLPVVIVVIFLALLVIVGGAVLSKGKGGKGRGKGGKKIKAKDHAQVLKEANRRLAQNPKDPDALLALGERWGNKYTLAVRSWENNWEGLATLFAYTDEIRRLIYTTNPIEGYNRQLRKATKTKGAFPTPEAVRKSFWLAHQNIAQPWDRPLHNWELILNQLAIRFENRFPL